MLYALCNFLQKLSKLHKLAVVKHQLKRFSAKFLPSKNHLARNIHILQVFFLQDLAQNLASLALKMKFFLQDMKNLARKICKIIFLQDFDQILQENYLTIFSCKILARFFISCKKSFIFSARLARFSARSCKSCKKNTCKIYIFLARRFLLGNIEHNRQLF